MEGTATASVVPTYGAAATLQYKGSAAQTTGPEFLTPWAGTGGVKIENASGVTLNAIKTINATSSLTIGSSVANSVFSDGGFQLTCTGTLNLTSGTFKLGNSTATTFPAFATLNITAGTTVEYASSAAQTISSTPTYSNLTLSGNSTKTLGGATVVARILTISAGTLDVSVSNYGLTVRGNWVNNGTFTAQAGTVTFDGTTTISGSGTHSFYSITINSTKSLTGPSSGTIYVYGNWANSGSFTHNSSTVTFRGTSQSDITGSTTFYNLTINTATDGAKTVRFGAGNTQTISNTLALTGASGKTLTIRSTSAGTQGTLAIPGSISSGVDYVDVDYSAISGGTITTGNNYTDGGHNTNWIFPTAGISISGTSDSTGTVAVAVNSALQTGKTTTISGGTWTILTVTVNSGDIVTVWIDGAIVANKSTAVTKYDGTGNVPLGDNGIVQITGKVKTNATAPVVQWAIHMK
jgi:hypothetical protein